MKRILAFVLSGALTCAGADLKVKIVAGAPAGDLPVMDKCASPQCVSVPDEDPLHEEVMYVHGASQRVEFKGLVSNQGPPPYVPASWTSKIAGAYRATLPHMAVITHCDTGQVIELDLDSHEYREFRQPKYPDQKKFQSEVERARKDAQRRVIWSTADTGERRDFFGYPAEHHITTITETVLSTRHQEVVDGWYVDLPQPGCAPEYLRQGQTIMESFGGRLSTDILTSCECFDLSTRSGYQAYSALFWAEGHFIPIGFRAITSTENAFTEVQTNFLYVGFTPGGLAVQQAIGGGWESRGAGGKDSQGTEKPLEVKVTELSDAPVDPALFEIPPGFKKVDRLYRHHHFFSKAAEAPQP